MAKDGVRHARTDAPMDAVSVRTVASAVAVMAAAVAVAGVKAAPKLAARVVPLNAGNAALKDAPRQSALIARSVQPVKLVVKLAVKAAPKVAAKPNHAAKAAKAVVTAAAVNAASVATAFRAMP